VSEPRQAGQLAAASWLLNHGAEINSRAKEGKTPLSVAKGRGHVDVANLLVGKGGVE
jgi:ankyrin repeat protein